MLSIVTSTLAALYHNFSELITRGNLVLPTRSSEWITFNIATFERVAYVPDPADANHGTPEHSRKLKQIYQLDDFVEISEGDTVFDIGAYVGTFSILAAETAERVIAIDPNASVDSSLEKNTSHHDNIHIVPKAAWNENTNLDLKLSFAPSDNSLLDIDSKRNDLMKEVTVRADTIQNISRELGVEEIDFLKIEAEGAEPEVLEGALQGDIPIQKGVINCTPERHGEAPTDEIVTLLDKVGYDYRVEPAPFWNDDMVYAVRDEV
jgi:FkbM family methyltransferase